LGVSRERVRQIEARAFEKVKKAVQASVQQVEQPSLSWNVAPGS
jgi:DNA-directed RNA polymerase sigma subunit (sigma70/sigma32)